MIIHSTFKDYEVNFEENFHFFDSLLAGTDTEYVIDKTVYGLYPSLFANVPQDRLIVIEACEENKVIDTALSICEKMTEIPAKRNAHLVSIGGGIIQDITGFVANVLYRGIAWTFVPTTLLSACDSCIGGKTSLNYKRFKNLLGTFYPPDRIYICPKFFATLSQRDYQSGLGEVIKFNIMAGPEGLNNIEKNIGALLARDEDVINTFVHSSLSFKKPFIEVDEFDKNERIKLNFAHTFGHAIETVTSYEIPHGTAVAIGMIMANHVSVRRGLLSKNTEERSKAVLLQVIHIHTDLALFAPTLFLEAMHKDKKQTSDLLTAVLMAEDAERLHIVHDLQPQEVAEAIEAFVADYAAESAK